MKIENRIFRSLTLLLLIAMMIIVSIPSSDFANQSTDANQKVRVLIEFKEFPGKSEAALIKSHGGEVRHMYRIIPSIAVEIPAKAVEALKHNKNILRIESDILAYTTDIYSDELNRTWGMLRIGESTAHANAYFGSSIGVAVIDTGINGIHPDLAASYAGGYDFVNDDGDPNDIDGHGTHVAGTIAAVRDGIGVVGAAPNAKLFALKALEGGSGNFGDIIAALDWIVAFNDNPANTTKIRVTNNSYGSASDPGVQVKAAFDNAYSKGILSIASAGNSGNRSGTGDSVGYPAKYPSVVAVAASDSANKRATFSSTGPDVEIISPGVSIYSTWLNNQYAYLNGTSMASPHVAGIATQVYGANSNLSNDQVRNILRTTTKDIGLPQEHQGYGLVQADLATAAANPVVPVYGNLDGYVYDANSPGGSTGVQGATVTVNVAGRTAITDSNGYYLIQDILPGSYTVHATASGYEPQEVANIGITADVTTRTDFSLTLHVPSYVMTVTTDKSTYARNAVVNITVSLKDGTSPVAGIPVSVTITTPNLTKTSLSGTTDSTGTAILKHKLSKTAMKGTYTVNATSTVGGTTLNRSTSFTVK